MNWEDGFKLAILGWFLILTFAFSHLASYIIEWVVNYFTKEH